MIKMTNYDFIDCVYDLVEYLSEEELTVVNQWQEARNNKNFELADELRQVIVDKGIEL